MKPMTEQHLALFRRHMVEIIDMHFDLASEELGKEVLYEMIYGPRHPYGHLTLGHAEAVERLTLDDVRAFYA